MRKLIAFAAVLATTLVVAIAPAGAVTDGELDGNATSVRRAGHVL